MIRFRYRLSWLLLVPAVLAAVVWWYKPLAPAAYDYLAEPKSGSAQAPGFYHVRQEYLDRQLLLEEIRECDYAIVFLGALYSPNAKITIQHLRDVSESSQGQVPIFICGFVADEFLRWFPKTTFKFQYSDTYLCIVQRGVVTHQFDGYLTTQEIHTLLKQILPWNYQL